MRIARQTDIWNADLYRDPRDDVEDVRQDVEMLMRIDVSDREAGVGDTPELAARFARDVGAIDPALVIALHEGAVAGKERAVGADERTDFAARRQRSLPDERQMRAHVQVGHTAQEAGGVLEVLAAGDDAAGGEDPFAMRSQDAARDARMQTDVVAGRDQEADRSSAAAATTAPRAALRRRGRFISGYSDTSSRRIFTITPTDESVDRPRVRGK